MPIRDTALLEKRLDEFNPQTRRDALAALAALAGGTLPETGRNVNLHCHSFFSYNADGWSPTRIAWECRKRGLYAAALCDFDVLDGLDEFLAAGRTIGLRTAVHLETRAFLREYAAHDINSPGEPGVTYIMGTGFFELPASTGQTGQTLDLFRRSARARNESLISRINGRVPEIALNYTRDVLPLTPRDVATERHIIRAYAAAGRKAFADPVARASFWAPLLKRAPEACLALETDQPAFEEAVRSALAKRGGIGYQQPDEYTFPPADDFIAWVRACRAIPTITWLDGTSRGEADCGAMLDLLRDKGCAALNIVPDRNWNIKKPDEQAAKVAKLDEVVAAAVARDLPINIGTEMNRAGLPFADDLSGPVLGRHAAAFVQGAQIMVGHTVLSLYADAPYLGPRALAEFKATAARNRFYASVGDLPPVTQEFADSLLDAGPERAFAKLHDAARRR
jgi:hypothetical protein